MDMFKEKKNLSNVAAATLGIAGDGASNLLFRLKEKSVSFSHLMDKSINESMISSLSNSVDAPPDFNPKIWFIHIGIEDFMKGCSEEVVLVGILRVVEELMVIKKDAKIIISPINPIRESAYTLMPHFGNGKLGEERKQALKDARKRFGKGTDELKAFKARIKAERKADRKGLTDRGVITPEGMHQLL
mmetsp:Transcript_4396/g.4543  ORF Transcript_4396/g.4543 Transcript_4396/m.4543 type:complete len:188 (-) Transcript_4396:215-778(-)